MSVGRVYAHTNNLSAELFELGILVVKLDDLGGAHKGEIEGVEEEHDPFALEGS